MPENRFTLTRIFKHKGRVLEPVRENTGQKKQVFWHILRIDSSLKTCMDHCTSAKNLKLTDAWFVNICW